MKLHFLILLLLPVLALAKDKAPEPGKGRSVAVFYIYSEDCSHQDKTAALGKAKKSAEDVFLKVQGKLKRKLSGLKTLRIDRSSKAELIFGSEIRYYAPSAENLRRYRVVGEKVIKVAYLSNEKTSLNIDSDIVYHYVSEQEVSVFSNDEAPYDIDKIIAECGVKEPLPRKAFPFKRTGKYCDIYPGLLLTYGTEADVEAEKERMNRQNRTNNNAVK